MSNAQLSGNTAPVNSWQHSLLSIHMPFSSSPAFGQDVGKNKKFHYPPPTPIFTCLPQIQFSWFLGLADPAQKEAGRMEFFLNI